MKFCEYPRLWHVSFDKGRTWTVYEDRDTVEALMIDRGVLVVPLYAPITCTTPKPHSNHADAIQVLENRWVELANLAIPQWDRVSTGAAAEYAAEAVRIVASINVLRTAK